MSIGDIIFARMKKMNRTNIDSSIGRSQTISGVKETTVNGYRGLGINQMYRAGAGSAYRASGYVVGGGGTNNTVGK